MDKGNYWLTDIEISMIRELYKSGKWTQVQLAKKFKVNQSHISRVIHGIRRGIKVSILA